MLRSAILIVHRLTGVLSSVVLVCASEFFESEDDVLQGFDVRDLVQRRDLQLIEQLLHPVRVEPLGNSFQSVKTARCDSSICSTFCLTAASRISLG